MQESEINEFGMQVIVEELLRLCSREREREERERERERGQRK